MATQTLYESENDVLRAGVSEPEADERAFAIWADELSAYTAEQLDVSKHPATRVLILLDWMGEFAAGTLDTLHEPALLSMDSRALATISKARDAIIALIPRLIEDNAPNLGSGFIDGTISAVLAQCEADQTPILCIVPALIAQLTWLVGVYDAARRWDL